jgi:hypothetical protein
MIDDLLELYSEESGNSVEAYNLKLLHRPAAA